MGTWPIEAWMRKSGVLLTKRSLALMVKRELHLLQKRMVPWVVGTTLKRSITESTTRTQKTKDQMSLSEEWMRKFMVSLLTIFPHLTPLSEALMLSFQMVPIQLLSRELPSVLESIIRSITTNIIRDQMSLSEEWTRKSMVSLLTLFPHLTPLSEALLHSCQMVLMNLLSRVLHSTREDTTTNITREILLREVWMRKSMVSLLTPFHHSTPELEALCHSFQTAQTHLPIPQLAILPLRESITTNITREILLREVWMRKSTVSVPTPFHHSTPDLEANCHSFQTALTHQPTHHLANLTLPLREDTTADITRDQISMREEWTLMFGDSPLRPFHQ